jgi:hypothetical protein
MTQENDQMTKSNPDTAIRELDRRTGDGINARLLWDPVADEVAVAGHDTRNDESRELEVTAADPLVAFNHPFAYTNSRPPTGHSIAA